MSIAGAARRYATVSIEEPTSYDGQGLPTYTARGSVHARPVYEDQLIVLGDGSKTRTTLTLFVDAGESTIPADEWRVTVAAVTYLVREHKQIDRLSGRHAYTRLRCREEEN